MNDHDMSGFKYIYSNMHGKITLRTHLPNKDKKASRCVTVTRITPYTPHNGRPIAMVIEL